MSDQQEVTKKTEENEPTQQQQTPVATENTQEVQQDQQQIQQQELQQNPEEKVSQPLSSAREQLQKAVKKVELGNQVLRAFQSVGEGRHECLNYFKDQIDIFLDKFDNDFWHTDYDNLIWDFANNEQQIIMFCWVEENKLAFNFLQPPKNAKNQMENEFCYFLKIPTQLDNNFQVDFSNISTCFVSGKIQNNYLKGLLHQMNNAYIFNFIRDKSWPENAKKEFMGQLHRFMATLTEQAYAQEGFTELYIPNEYYTDVDSAVNDKDLIQRLETTLIHWIRQIKEIVNNQDSQHDQENAGPLDEIAYWRSRKNNLSYIDAQLDKPELLQIKKILSVVDSTYLKGFEELTTKIKAGSVEADDNLLFLKSLYDPCKSLQDCESPKQIPEILPSLLNRVRMIWEKSKFYNTTERIQGLLHKISNEIIKRCKQQINIKDMLDGDVEKCMQDLQDSIECGKKWRKIYEITAGIIAKNNKQNKWDFNLNTIFAQVEAFVQRCIELKEICEGQLQFARKGSDSQIPQFGGSKGPEIVNILEEIKITFRKSIEKIRQSEQDKILDVKASSWHDEFNAFKIGMKDLDIMYQKVINFAFESVMTVKEGVEMLEAFDYLAKRESIKNAVKKKAIEVINYFQQELESTKHEYDGANKRYKNLVPLNQGKHSGYAVWVRNLIHRIEQMKEQLDRLTFVEESVKKPALDKYDQHFSTYRQVIIQFKLKEWRDENKDMEDNHNPMEGKLSKAILIKNDDNVVESKNSLLQSKPGHLESNFDRQLYNLMKEVSTWKKLANFGAVVPSYADDINTVHKEPLRVLREYVMLTVRDYNQIIESMEEFEENKQDQLYKKLFKQHLEQTEKVIAPGLNKLKWSSKTILENFVRDVRRSCSELSFKLTVFKTNTMKIYSKCAEISQIPLILIDKKIEYDIKFFMEEQERHRKLMQERMIHLLEDIKVILCESYDYFLFQRIDIQKQWFRYVAQIDNKIEDALKKSLKVSLLNLLKTVGDEKTNPIPQFRLSVELENNQLGFRPTTDFLISQIRQTTAAMTEVVKDFPRMDNLIHSERVSKLNEVNIQIEKEIKNPIPGRPQKQPIKIEDIYLEDEGKKLPSFFDRISEDHDIKRYTDKILSNLKKTCDGLGELLDPWRKRDNFWLKIDIKEKMTKMMAEQNESITHLKSKIENYEIIQSEIHAQKTSDKSGCITLDNTSIKNTLIDIMAIWQNVTLTAIQERALKDLTGLYQLFSTSSVQLQVPIQDLQQFKKQNDLLKKLMEDKPQLEAKLVPLEEKFKLLDEYNLALKDEEMNKRNMLRQEWQDFCVMLDKASITINKSYTELYNEQQVKLEDFVKESGENKNRFLNDAPFTSTTFSNDKAFQLLAQFKEDTKNLRHREEQQKFGVELFKIPYVPSPELEFVEREIQQLEKVWLHKETWDKRWKQFMTYQFRNVNIEEIEDEIQDEFLTPMKEYSREVQKWEVTMNVKIILEQVKSTLPLIQMLREPYMRERHWEKMQRLLGSIIEPNSETFSIGEVFKLNLIQNAEAVREICEVAREEYKIESALAKIEKTWDVLNLEMEPHKKTYKIRRVDEINSTLEEHMTTLASQKTTLFYESFKQVIENWEVVLTQVMETIEILVFVQRQWIYLESIFASQQNDQDKQLIGDITKFMAVNTRLSFHMGRMYDDRNAKRALIVPDFLTDLKDMSKKLDESQKILFQLLERKRKEFPRFYFIYNDDLFELLGNSKEPQRINKHIKKCFEGIKKLEFHQEKAAVRSRAQETWEVLSIISPDGEVLPLNQKVPCELGVEFWLFHVEKMMRETLKRKLMNAHQGIKKKDAQGMKWVDKWIQSWPGQILITACQIFWTTESFNAINQIYNSEKPDKARAWKVPRDEKKNFIEQLTNLVRKPASEVDRAKIVALITVMVHSRDIMDSLYKTCVSPNSFDWMKQLRFYSQPQSDCYDCYIEHVNTNKFQYGFEYQGNNGRLVATGLTDRCYMTLTTAIMLKKGGAPQGPAGTGKTETVKDLGKALARYVLVFNCSDGLDYKNIFRMFSGLMQTGSWGCFDEFNRIELEVLSVVAQQVHSIYNALKQYNPETCTSFAFEGEVIPIKDQVAIFITMNPGYAGRSELPDNLKSQFRPISMMLPEMAMICEIMLQSEGFKYGKALSVKIKTLFNLMMQQLSKQDHYDFGLRAIKSVLNCAGIIKRESTKQKEKDAAQKELQKEMTMKEIEQEEIQQEVKILMKAIRDMNLPKFVAEDLPLFNALFQDLFPNIDMVETVNQELQDMIETTCKKMNLQICSTQVSKIIQLYDSMNTRHGNMLVGKSLSGKTTCWKVLKQSLNTLSKDNKAYPVVKHEALNPKAITINDLFGYMDINTMEWTDGVLSSMMARMCRDETSDYKWMLLDGPVDTLWIESMNTVLDDNKVLTLLNGDRISLPQQVSLLFEVQDLSVASPATVSRAGMIYLDINDLGWENFTNSWIDGYKDEMIKENLHDLIHKWIPKVLKAKNQCKELIPISNSAVVMQFCRLLDSFQRADSSLSFETAKKEDLYISLLEKWFAFALIWSVGAAVNEEGRNIFDYHLRDIESMFPHNNTVYDYYINTEKQEWALWEEKISAIYKPPAGVPYHKMFVPTTDTTRNKYIIQALQKQNINILVCGVTGTGKTVLLNGILSDLDDSYSIASMVFSAQTNAAKVQELIESKLVKRTKNKMVPHGKKAMFFIDDLNMPRKDVFGTQSALEIIRQWLDYQGWFDATQKELFKYILDIQMICAMGPPGGGRAAISQRCQNKFYCMNFTFPNDKQLQRIFQSILAHKFSEFDEEIKPLSEPLAIATINIYRRVSDQFLPIPAKCHYMFNLRDMSKVIQGLYQINRFYCDSKINLIRVWVHECLRVFHDRLVDLTDRAEMKKVITEQIELVLLTNMKECTNEKEEDSIFVDFFDESAPNVYQEVGYGDRDKLKQIVEQKLLDYNEKAKKQQMQIVLFQDAIYYICKIQRIIKLSKGHGLLVGDGGSGRHCLTKLAAFIAEFQIFQVELHKAYKLREFREDIKRWSTLCGLKNQQGVFLFSDNEIVNESFMEDLNNILTVGEIPNLFSAKDDMPGIREKVRKDYLNEKKLTKDARIHDEELNDYFFNRVQTNFHLMICMSKTGDALKNYIRMYPGLVNNTTCIWFLPWPNEALIEVADQYFKNIQIGINQQEESTTNIEQIFKNLSTFCGNTHAYVQQLSQKMFLELKRTYYVTPTIYIDLVNGYTQLLAQKQSELGLEIDKLSQGLQKLDDAAESSETLQKLLGVNQIELSKKSKDCEDLMIKIENDTINANESQKEVEKRTAQLDKEKAEIEVLAKDAQAEVEKAEPILRAAEDGLNNLEKKKIAELRTYNQPPPAVNVVCSAVMTIFNQDTSWASVKKFLNDPDFLKKLKTFDKENMSQATIKKMEKYTHKSDMSSEQVTAISEAAGSMWDWVLAMEAWAKANKDIEPKRKKVANLKEKLKKSEDELMVLRENFIKLKETIIKLNEDLVRFKNDMVKYSEETSQMQIKLDRADKLISGLATTREGWIQRKKDLIQNYQFLVGDALLTASYISYSGPFPSEFREKFLTQMMLSVKKLHIPHSKFYKFAEFMVKPTDFLSWGFQGLPDDPFSKDNGALVTKGKRWPLLIDPQMQGNKWIKNMEKEINKSKLMILDPQIPNYMQSIEKAIATGMAVILQNVDEELDSNIDPILKKSLKKIAGKLMIILGDKEILYDPNFRFYMTTKIANPKYKPEVSTQVTLVNFIVKEKGLEEQLTSEVIRKMENNLEKTRIDLIQRRGQNENKLKQLDDEILRLLQETKGSLVDDEGLIKTLQLSKETEEDVRSQIENSVAAMKKTLAARENYKNLAKVAAKLFFIVNDFSQLNNMYQMSLDSYIYLFSTNITKHMEKNPGLSDSLQEKLQSISERHKQEVYKYACRGFFEKDKLLLSFQMAVNLSTDIDMEEYQFFLRGGNAGEMKNQPLNPNPDWINQNVWNAICDLEKLPSFVGIIGAFVHNSKEWKRWFMSATPESDNLPGEWEQKCDRMRKMILLKIIRPDRVLFATTSFVAEKIGDYFVNPPPVFYDKIYEDSYKTQPIVFILVPGVDPLAQLDALALSKDKRLIPVSLGQGQTQKAKEKIVEATRNGTWLYLTNCHLSLSFLKELEKILEQIEQDKNQISENFRLFLSTNPHPNFPISVLQNSLRVTTEPPKGLKQNMSRLYMNMPEDKFNQVKFQSEKTKYKKLIFSLSWFHSLIIERNKFKSLGWNIKYDFSDSDWITSDQILLMCLDTATDKTSDGNRSVQWDMIKYIISEVLYGGRVTDDMDRRLMNVYANQFFNDKVISEEKYVLSDPSLPYVIPDEVPTKDQKQIDKNGANPSFYEAKIREFPTNERPEAFGQHINAEISSQIADTNNLIASIISLQPRIGTSGEESKDSRVLKVIKDLLAQLPSTIDVEEVIMKINPSDQNPLKIVLLQEISRHNQLLDIVYISLVNLEKGIHGIVLISEELETIYDNLYLNKVPTSWGFCYYSLKNLISWMNDLEKRVQQLYDWAFKGQPNVFWISGFSFPTGFTTALQQQSSRKLNISIDQFSWEFFFLNIDQANSQTSKDGAYITGLYLEGAGWDQYKNYLTDAEAMKLHYEMPIIHMKPVINEGKVKQKKGQALYQCPTYAYPIRTGQREKPSFMFIVNLPCKPVNTPLGLIVDTDFYVKRGTALLMSLAD